MCWPICSTLPMSRSATPIPIPEAPYSSAISQSAQPSRSPIRWSISHSPTKSRKVISMLERVRIANDVR